MIRLLFLVLLLCAALWFGPVLMQNPGYLMLVLGGWTVETTLVGLVLILLLGLFAVWLLWSLIKPLLAIRRWNWHPFRRRRQRKARHAFEQAALALAAGRFEQAELAFDQAEALTDFSELRRQMACYAAFQAGHPQKAMQLAEWLDDGSASSLYVKADLLLRQQQASDALALLQPSMTGDAAELLAPLYFKALLMSGQAAAALTQVPVALEQNWCSKNQWHHLRYQLYPYAIVQLAEKGAFSSEADYWQQLPGKERKSMASVLGQVWALARQGQTEKAEILLVDHLSFKDLADCWPVLRQIPLKRQVNQLRKQLQHWLRDHQQEPLLFAALAYCAEQEGELMQAQLARQKATELSRGVEW
ncbi:heme biosynthesis HemY N-terminal domain-containing protein [Rheinheimera sp.]|uniref:heme biosynthesis HemY N-terminal domain-containing protein n=1 Tax=Rheinheimera sp. TaxID=1869214 RepID=UPI003AF8B35C